jgi:ribosomal protein S18 acetylase RimI-like enzyme
MEIAAATAGEHDGIWEILAPVIAAGETYTLPRDMSRADALAYWFADGHEVFVAREEGRIVGTYFLSANQKGGGSHVANCGYVTAPWAGGRGVARAMCEHSLVRAAARGFRAMQFNFVVSSNERAVRLWQACGFDIVGRLPLAFHHPRQGYVDAFVMYRTLEPNAYTSGAPEKRS